MWKINKDGKGWEVAGGDPKKPPEFGKEPWLLSASTPAAQRYNAIFTVLAELNRGVEYAPRPAPLTPKR